MRSVQDNVLFYHDTIRDLLQALNSGIHGVVFVVDDSGVMVGLLTDGDVRRALLKGAKLTEPIERYMNRLFKAGRSEWSRAENMKLLDATIRHLPILDSRGRPIDMISWAEMWRLPVMEPSLGGNELKYVSDCIATNWISSQGEYVNRFEEAFRTYVGTNHALTTSNGTSALHLALTAMGIGPGDEVIVPDLTFGASANAVRHTGAMPVFADINPVYWGLDPDALAAAITPRTRAIMPVHLYGHPCDMEPIVVLARKHNLFVVEDCAEALGAEYRGHPVGTIGDAGCFSFFANKVITTGEGGMVTTNNPALLHKMRVLRDHGMEKSRRYWHLYPGFNYRMTNIQAAIGLAQLEQVDHFLELRRNIVGQYNAGLAGIPGIQLPLEMPWARNIYWLYAIVVDEEAMGISRDALIAALSREGIETRPFFYPLHIQPAFNTSPPAHCPVAENIAARGLNLPTSSDLKPEDIERVCHAIRQLVSDARLIRSHIADEPAETVA